MKLIVFYITVFLITYSVYGQSKLNESLIPITVYISDLKDIPHSSKTILENKLKSFIVNNGFGNLDNGRFVLTANVIIRNKGFTSSSPVMITTSLDVYLYIGDGVDGTLFSTVNMNLKGVGTSEIKSFNSAFSKINLAKDEYSNFINISKNKITQYYSQNCDFLIQKANHLTLQGDYKKALYNLSTMPIIDSLCVIKIENSLVNTYQLMIDNDCQNKLQNAKAIWSVEMNTNSAEKVIKEIMSISPLSKCFEETQLFINEMRDRILEIDKREWDFQMKQEDKAANIRLSKIEAAKLVGVAYGNNQPKQAVYNIVGWW